MSASARERGKGRARDGREGHAASGGAGGGRKSMSARTPRPPCGACGKLRRMNDKAAPAPVTPFLDRLGAGTVVCDGAMGTMLYARGRLHQPLLRRAEPLQPRPRAGGPRGVPRAGADVIETNTFGANRFKLGPHGLEDQVAKINREGARIAREAAKGRALVAGSIGPIGKPLAPIGHISAERGAGGLSRAGRGPARGRRRPPPARDDALARTRRRRPCAAVRSVSADVPVAVSLTFNEEGSTIYGDTPEEAVRELEALGVPDGRGQLQPGAAGDAGDAAAHGGRRAHGEAVRQPNAGSAALVEGRYVYLCTPEYMAAYARRFIEAGASAVGGCCGTTPAHIKDLVRSVRMFQPGRAEVKVLPPSRPKEAPAPVSREAEVAARPATCGASSWSASSSTRRAGRTPPSSSSARGAARRTRSTRSTSRTVPAPRRA